jgi:hypothetical protein
MYKKIRLIELTKYIRQNDDPRSVVNAINELRSEGWLYDGSLAGHNLYKADLSNANLSRANLNDVILAMADLSGANLHNADLSNAVLMCANLADANLTGATLDGADLHLADLSRSILRNAKLTKATLRGAMLNQADIYGADFNNAYCSETVFSGVDFTNVQGLASILHGGSSYISADTLSKFKYILPQQFVQGTGISTFINDLNDAHTNDIGRFFSCFISYSHVNKSFATHLYERLEKQGIYCWIDKDQVNPGQDIYDEIDRGIQLWDKVLLCCSKDSLSSWWVENEIAIAFAKEREFTKIRGKKVNVIIPIDLDGYIFSNDWKSGYREQIRRRLAANFIEWEDPIAFSMEFKKMLKALRSDEGRELPPPSLL